MFQDKEKISANQALMLILAGIIGYIFVVFAVPAIKNSGKEAWITVLLAHVIAYFIGISLINLGLRFPEKTIIQYLPQVLGKIPGKIVGLIFILSFWFFAALVHRESAEVMQLFMAETPIYPFVLLTIYLSIYTLYKGIEVFARISQLLVPLSIIFILTIIIFILPEVNWDNLTPFMENGINPIIKGLPIQLAFSVETLLFMGFWLPCLNERKHINKQFLVGITIGGILLTLIIIVTLGFSGVKLTTKITFPILYLARYIYLFQFLTGFEAIFIILWLTSSFLQIMVFFYPAVVGLAQWLNLKDYRPLIIPMSLITFVLALLPPSLMSTLKLDDLNDLYVILPLGLIIPIIWLIALIRKLDES